MMLRVPNPVPNRMMIHGRSSPPTLGSRLIDVFKFNAVPLTPSAPFSYPLQLPLAKLHIGPKTPKTFKVSIFVPPQARPPQREAP